VSGRYALLIGNGEFDASDIANLITPVFNTEQLKAVLLNQQIGQFDRAEVLPNGSCQDIKRAIATFFKGRSPDDVLLLFYSGHGLKDWEHSGELFLAAKETETDPDLLDTTAVAANFIAKTIDRTPSRNVIVLLDCCYSGAATTGSMSALIPKPAGTADAFKGQGNKRIILTATDSTQRASERQEFVGASGHSVFSHCLIEGLSTGEADADRDGEISIEELYEYLIREVSRLNDRQTPKKFFGLERKVVVAFNPYPNELPVKLRAAIADPDYWMRFGAIKELNLLLTNDRLKAKALEALESLAQYDRDVEVRELAARTIAQPLVQATTAPPFSSASANPELETATDTLLQPYLEWLIAMHGRLELRGIREARGYPTIPLEKVYVALKGDRTSSYERIQAREMLEAEVIEMVAALEGEFAAEELAEELEYRRRQILVEHPIMPSLVERDRPENAAVTLPTDIITLGQAFQQERWLVILGDPGSGKTTLTRWLAVKLARAMLDDEATVQVPSHQVDPDVAQSETMLNLGLPRLPVIVRVSDYAEAYDRSQLMLIDYLGHHPWLGQYPTHAGEQLPAAGLNVLIKDYLRRGRAIIILDGMDEITTSTRRDDIVRAIEVFIQEWVNALGRPRSNWSSHDFWYYADEGSPLEIGGNQILITSRIAGYHTSPIKGPMTHVTIEPMSRVAVEHFCDSWTQAIYQLIDPDGNPEIVAQHAEREAQNLKQAIYAPHQRRVRELASNPLLVTILAIVFHRRGCLPQQRASLYQLALEILVEDWQQDRQNRQNNQKTGLTTEELVYVLSPLAAHIHSRYATGLIQEPELREVLSQNLAELPPYQGQAEHPGFKHKIEQFLRLLREEVGLLAARGEYLYGFLHLTFQEYLAALFLVRNKSTAAAAVIQRLDDPRWREPILLALGHVGSAWGPQERNQLLRSLLQADDPLGDLLPRTPLLIASALNEMSSVSEDIVTEVVRQLLFAYGDRQGINQIDQLKQRIETALATLRTGRNQPAVDRVFCDLLRQPPPHFPAAAAAVARLLHDQHWLTQETVAALFAALPNDNESWGWPIHGAIRACIAPALPLAEPKPPPPLEAEELKKLQETDIAQYQELMVRYAVAEAAYQEKRSRYERAKQAEAVKLPLEQLPFRQALLQHQDWVEQIQSNAAWLRLVTALYGGYVDHQAHQVLKEYDALARWLRMSEAMRENELRRNREYYVGQFGANDPVYGAAVYLDTGMDGKLERVQACPRFEPGAIYRDSGLTSRLLAVLRAGQTPDTLIPALWQLWHQAPHQALRVEAMLALIALGEAVTETLEQTLNSREQKPLADAVLTRLSQLQHDLQDPVTRALNTATVVGTAVDKKGNKIEQREKVLHQILRKIVLPDADCWCNLVDCISALAVRYSQRANDLPKLSRNLPAKAQARFLAEQWSYRWLGGYIDDAIYACAVALDEATSTPPALLIEALSFLSHSCNLQWSQASFDWKVEPLAPISDNPTDIPLATIDGVENSRLGAVYPDFMNALLTVFLNAVIPLAKQNPALIPEILLLNLSNRTDPDKVLEQLAPELVGRFNLLPQLIERVRNLTQPYYRARALLRLARYHPFRRKQYIKAALQTATRIVDAHQRCRVFEYLLPHVAEDQKTQLLQETLVTARQIDHLNNRARALGRLSKRFTGVQHQTLVRDAMTVATQVPDLAQRAELLPLLLPLASQEPELLADLRRVARALPDRWHRAQALGLQGKQMLLLQQSMTKTLQERPEHNEIWTILTLGATVESLLNYFQPSTVNLDGLWLQLAETPQAGVEYKLQAAGLEKGLTLTRIAAQTIAQLVNQGVEEIVHSLLPLLQNPTAAALPRVESWLNHWDEVLAHHAALYLAEPKRQLNRQTIDGLLALVTSRQDRSRSRALLTLHGPNGRAIERNNRFFKVSELDKQVLLKIMQTNLELQNKTPGFAHFHSLFIDVLHDDPDWINELVEAIDRDRHDAASAETVLRWIMELSPEVWESFKNGLGTSNNRICKALIQSLCFMFTEGNKMVYYQDPAPWLRDVHPDVLSQVRVLPTEPDPVIQSALTALKQGHGAEEDNLIALADATLAGYALTVEDIVFDRGEIVKQLKKQPQEKDKKNQHGGIPPASVMSLLGRMGQARLIRLGTGEISRNINLEDILVPDEPRIFPLLIAWLRQALQESIQNQDSYWKQTILLSDVAIYARQSPSTFVNLAREQKLEPLLARAIVEHNCIAGRKAACELVSHFSAISQATLNALLQALLDDIRVQKAAMETISKLRRIDGVALEELVQGLHDPSATVAAASAQVLATLGRGDRTKPEQRRQIVAALADAVRAPGSKRGMYVLGGTGGKNNPKQLVYQGRLDRVFFKALLEVTGSL